MIYNLYAIYDVAANNYNTPYIGVNDAVGIRNFDFFIAGTPGHLSDYECRCIGTINLSTGELEACSPRFVCRGGESHE